MILGILIEHVMWKIIENHDFLNEEMIASNYPNKT